jgi:hypothetical protein
MRKKTKMSKDPADDLETLLKGWTVDWDYEMAYLPTYLPDRGCWSNDIYLDFPLTGETPAQTEAINRAVRESAIALAAKTNDLA